jgi:hypothetical protein
VPRAGRATILATGLFAAAMLAGGCSAAGDPTGTAPRTEAQAQPPPPPVACMLDGAALAATTGLTWTPDQSTATDTRCVYDPAGASSRAEFLTVDVTTSTDDAASQLDTVAGVCARGSRADIDVADGGFVCRFDGGTVYAAVVRDGQLVTISTSAVPAGTTGAKLAVACTEQLRTIGSA